MALEDPFPCSQELATGPYPEPDESSLHPHILIIHISKTNSYKYWEFDGSGCSDFGPLHCDTL
jgi:hypothetical protein